PVRILASEFVGDGSFEVTNDGALEDSPEANAVVKLVDTDGIDGSERGGGFLRMTNADGGHIDLTEVPFEGSDVSDYQIDESSVGAYFGDLEAHIAETKQCLTSMYDSDLSNAVTITEEGGLVYAEDFADDQPNVIEYEDIAGKTVKLDRADGYEPTAEAPLVIKAPEGTTDLSELDFEGWSSQAGQDQSLARYILLDLSDVTGAVNIDGLELGAIWAPHADLNFNSGVSTNGQGFSGGDVTAAGGGEIHHHTFLGELTCGDEPGPDPSIGTSVAVDGSDAKVLPLTGGTVVDTVSFEGLTAGETYDLAGEVRTAPAGDENGITASAEFTPEAASGTTTVTFEITGEQVAEYAGRDLVVFEYLTLGGHPVAEHTDPNDGEQTFTVEEEPGAPGPEP